jgi:hypothetical protein
MKAKAIFRLHNAADNLKKPWQILSKIYSECVMKQPAYISYIRYSHMQDTISYIYGGE